MLAQSTPISYNTEGLVKTKVKSTVCKKYPEKKVYLPYQNFIVFVKQLDKMTHSNLNDFGAIIAKCGRFINQSTLGGQLMTKI